MDDQQKQQTELLGIMQDVAQLLHKNGKSEKEIDETILKLVAEVEMATVEEVIARLPADKRKLLEEMSAQKKPVEEISAKIPMDPAVTQKIQLQKFKEIFGKFVTSLDAKK